jgi:hypothetical protein
MTGHPMHRVHGTADHPTGERSRRPDHPPSDSRRMGDSRRTWRRPPLRQPVAPCGSVASAAASLLTRRAIRPTDPRPRRRWTPGAPGAQTSAGSPRGSCARTWRDRPPDAHSGTQEGSEPTARRSYRPPHERSTAAHPSEGCSVRRPGPAAHRLSVRAAGLPRTWTRPGRDARGAPDPSRWTKARVPPPRCWRRHRPRRGP